MNEDVVYHLLGAPYNDVWGTTEFMMPNRISGDMGLKIRPPTLQNALIISLERPCLAHGRINAPPHQQRTAEIGVGIVDNEIFSHRNPTHDVYLCCLLTIPPILHISVVY